MFQDRWRAHNPGLWQQRAGPLVERLPGMLPAGSPAAEACALPGIEQVWRRTRGDPRVTIAILDGPADLSHPSLRDARLQIAGPLRPDCRGNAACRHGTHVASLIFAQHGSGQLQGVAPDCRGIIIPVFSDESTLDGSVRPCTQGELANAIETALANGAHVINISAGQPGHAATADPSLRRAVERCAERGVLIAAAAGNDGCDCLHLPAALPMVLTVGAHAADGAPLDSSNFGAAYQSHGLAAPGVSILGAVPGGGYERRSGTSFAAPLVAGLAGLLLSARMKARGALTPADVRDAYETLLRSVAPCNISDRRECRRLLAGRVNPLKAFDLYLKGANDMDQLVQNSPQLHTGPDHAIEEREAPVAGPIHESATPAINPAWSPAAETPRTARPQAGPWSSPPANPARATPAARAGQLAPSECNSCQQGGSLVYALGELGFDFGTQARLDAMNAQMDEGRFPSNPRDLLDFLNAEGGSNLHVATAIIWTLNHDAMPFYAIRPEGAFARETYSRLLEFFTDQVDAKAERVSIPGVLDGTVTLMSGQQVPVLIPDLRGMFNWRTSDLIASVMGMPPEDGEQRRQFETKLEGMQNFLERIYFEVRNLGLTPQERALNFAATNAFNLERVFESAAALRLQLDEIGVERSPICRPDSECWDVRLIFFDPSNALGAARTAYRFTVDVSDVVPVLVGRVRSWAVR